ncbi:hypothetical protein D3C86_2134530 [compost metagenome]
MLFDPYIPYSIANRIIWAVENSKELYMKQSSLYNKFSARDWNKVANEYNDVFRKIMVNG